MTKEKPGSPAVLCPQTHMAGFQMRLKIDIIMSHPASRSDRLHSVVLSSLLFLASITLEAAAAQPPTYVNFEGKLTRPICLSPDGTRLFAVNTADARLSVFDVTHPLNPFL